MMFSLNIVVMYSIPNLSVILYFGAVVFVRIFNLDAIFDGSDQRVLWIYDPESK